MSITGLIAFTFNFVLIEARQNNKFAESVGVVYKSFRIVWFKSIYIYQKANIK